jgi:hypothetical protein
MGLSKEGRNEKKRREKGKAKEKKNSAVRRSPNATAHLNLYMYVQELPSPEPRGCLLSAPL